MNYCWSAMFALNEQVLFYVFQASSAAPQWDVGHWPVMSTHAVSPRKDVPVLFVSSDLRPFGLPDST